MDISLKKLRKSCEREYYNIIGSRNKSRSNIQVSCYISTTTISVL